MRLAKIVMLALLADAHDFAAGGWCPGCSECLPKPKRKRRRRRKAKP